MLLIKPSFFLQIYGASTASHRQNYTSLYSFDCEFRRCRNSLLFNTSGIRAATEILNVSEAARMPLVPCRNEICGMQISQVKNVQGRTFFNVPAGIFCALLVSASPISKRHFSTAMDGGGSTQQRGFCTAETPLKMYTDVHLLMRYLHRLFSKVFVLINTNYRCAKRTNWTLLLTSEIGGFQRVLPLVVTDRTSVEINYASFLP